MPPHLSWSCGERGAPPRPQAGKQRHREVSGLPRSSAFKQQRQGSSPGPRLFVQLCDAPRSAVRALGGVEHGAGSRASACQGLAETLPDAFPVSALVCPGLSSGSCWWPAPGVRPSGASPLQARGRLSQPALGHHLPPGLGRLPPGPRGALRAWGQSGGRGRRSGAPRWPCRGSETLTLSREAVGGVSVDEMSARWVRRTGHPPLLPGSAPAPPAALSEPQATTPKRGAITARGCPGAGGAGPELAATRCPSPAPAAPAPLLLVGPRRGPRCPSVLSVPPLPWQICLF